MGVTRPAEMKAGYYRAHAIRRAAERYGLHWDATHVAAVEGMIQAARRDARSCPDAVPFGHNHHNPAREWWAIRWDGVWLPVVYDAGVKALVSVLPAHAIDRIRGRLEGWAEPDPTAPALGPIGPPLPAPDPADRAETLAGLRAERADLREHRRRAEAACGELRKDHPARPPIVAEIARLNGRLAEIKAELKALGG